MEFGTMEYWEKQRLPIKNKLEDIEMHIDSLYEDIGDLKSQRDELQEEYNGILDEIKCIEDKEEKEIHEELMKNSMTYRATHTPSQQRLIG